MLVAQLPVRAADTATAATADPVAPVAVEQPTTTEQPDLSSAIAYRLCGNRKVEVTNDRTPTSTTYANPDGSLTEC